MEFRKFPPEIRENIWQCALPPRVLTITSTTRDITPGGPNGLWSICIATDTIVTLIMSTCKEAKKVVTTRYIRI
jgi:hypothetical protein